MDTCDSVPAGHSPPAAAGAALLGLAVAACTNRWLASLGVPGAFHQATTLRRAAACSLGRSRFPRS